MRLERVERGDGPIERLRRRLAELAGRDMKDTTRLLRYRPGLFGEAYLDWYREVMHGPSEWTEAQRQALAAHVSEVNGCDFCATTHARDAAEARREAAGRSPPTGSSSSAPAPGDVDAGPGDDERRMRAAEELIERLAREPAAAGPADVAPLRAAGVGDRGIRDVVELCSVMSVMNRIADALDFRL